MLSSFQTRFRILSCAERHHLIIVSLFKMFKGGGRCYVILWLDWGFSSTYLTKDSIDETGALKSLETRLSRAPGATREMLVDGVFGSFADDVTFREAMLILAPLYTETYDADAALIKINKTVFRAKTHSKRREILQ
jgi:hypothetical protein